MGKGKMIAIGIGIAVAVIVAVGITVSMQYENNFPVDVSGNQTGEGRHIELRLEEKVGMKDRP
ncbi:MAG: hypothetical protein QXU32_00040 [Nitrososphaerales archaeon]